ncbi:choice-of-anchor I family protein [Brevibacterium samyangense]|uniref:Gram-positive cocci surface proteins LPxTG domain-containing protein n=1 Tax=Brevibacterium samyangense TaxID=366888 RepID=A0ABP5EUJ8_9MICO
MIPRRTHARGAGSPRVLGAGLLASALVLPAAALAALPAHATGTAPSTAIPHVAHAAEESSISLSPLGSHRENVFDAGAAEIVQYYAAKQQALVVNAQQGVVQIIDAADPTSPEAIDTLPTAGVPVQGGGQVPAGGVANSVAVREDGLALIAVEAETKTDPGWVVAYDVSGEAPRALGAVTVGALPDSVVISPEGEHAVVANEGEPAEDYSVDPEGTVSVIALPVTPEMLARGAVRTADFHAYEADGEFDLPQGIRIFGGREDALGETPEFPVSENLEPEYSTILGDRAYVTLQEANGIAVIDLATASVVDILPLGSQDLSEVPTDLTNEDDAYNPVTAPITTFRQPDTVKSVTIDGTDYLLTANEGDSRDWDGYGEEARVADLGAGDTPPICDALVTEAGFDSAAAMQEDTALGRLTITLAQGLSADGSCYEEIHGFGARSFSILTTDGELVFDSGNDFEAITAQALPDQFNANNDESGIDARSDDKGPEPEAIEVAQIGDRTYAFIGLERVGGIMVYDITDPGDSRFQTYVNTRNFDVELIADDVENAGDSGPESIVYVPAEDGSAGMIVVGNEVTGSTTFFDVTTLGTQPSSTPPATVQPSAPTEPTDPGASPVPETGGAPTASSTESSTGEAPTGPGVSPGDAEESSPAAGPGRTSVPNGTADATTPGTTRDADAEAAGSLPRTGASAVVPALLGLALLAAGGLAVAAARYRRH